MSLCTQAEKSLKHKLSKRSQMHAVLLMFLEDPVVATRGVGSSYPTGGGWRGAIGCCRGSSLDLSVFGYENSSSYILI